MAKAAPFTVPNVTATVWDLIYSQTLVAGDGLGTRADGFGNFDVAIFNGAGPRQAHNDGRLVLP